MSDYIGRTLTQVGHTSATLAREFGSVSLSDQRARSAMMAAAAVALAVPVADAMNLPDPWWAAISAVVSTMPTRPASIERGLHRLAGTAAGAVFAYILVGWIAYDHFACCLMLFAVSTVGIFGMAVSRHGYAWLFFGITFMLAVVLSLNDPSQAFHVAVSRTLEVGVGISSAIVVATLLAPEAPSGTAASPEVPGWRDPFGVQWLTLTHALRSGFAVAVLPLIWETFNLPGLATVAATIVAVMAVPAPIDDLRDVPGRIVAKAAYRMFGCFIGGVAGLAALTVSPTTLVPWLLLVCCGVWLFVWLQGSPSGAGYVGTQACVVYLVTLVQGEGPPASILPGIDRFVGIMLGFFLLLVITLLFRPVQTE